MSDQALSAIASLQARVDQVFTELGALSGQIATKADASAVAALTSTVTSQSGAITQLGQSISSLKGDGYITGEKLARQRHEAAHRGQGAAAKADSALDTTCVRSESGAFIIDPGKGTIALSQTYINELALESGRSVMAGLSIGGASLKDETKSRASADQALTSHIGSFQTVLPVNADKGSDLADVVRKVIRDELRPGGLLHRS